MRTAVIGSLALLLLSGSVRAQGRGDYVNFETPQQDPILCAEIDGTSYLFVTNTPAGTVEVYDTDEAAPASQRMVARIVVGLEPVSVIYSPRWQRIYVANFLSDSITSVVVRAPTGPSSFQATHDRNVEVGDEPLGLALTPDESALIVTFNTTCAMGFFRPLDLTPVPASPPALPDPTDEIDLIDTSADPDIGIKEPRAARVAGNQVFVLGFKGGNEPEYDFDLYSRDLTSGAVTSLGGLGSTNFNMAFSSSGDLYVVGGEAQNHLIKEPNVAAAPTGFVESTLYLVQGAGTASPTVLRRDLNEAIDPGSGNLEPVSFPDALAMPTSVVPFEVGGVVKRVYLTAFGSGLVAAITPEPVNDPDRWPITRIPIRPVSGSTNPVSGPRALASCDTARDALGQVVPRIYTMNRLDNSVTIIDPIQNQVVGEFALSQDPTPQYIRTGRQFLYSAHFSGTGYVSCASCHTEGKTDAIAWELGDPDPAAVGAPFPRLFSDGPISILLSQIADLVQNGFDPDKGFMVTQSLQGLLNWEVDPEGQDFVTNAPYHWRGDRSDFTKFNGAFVTLMGAPNLTGDPLDPKGITDEEMSQYEEFVNSIHYPPNPQQPRDRRYSGDFGPPESANDVTVGDGAQRGLKVFFVKPLGNVAGRSCHQCHSLPEGSNNKFTVNLAGGGTGRQPLETAALRGLFQKEMSRDKDGVAVSDVVIGNFGLEHTGASTSLNDFVKTFFTGQFVGVQEQRLDLQRFLHELDWGLAPSVGRTATVTRDNKNDAPIQAFLDEIETQAREANVGIALHARFNAGLEGYWYDAATNLYVEESSGASKSRGTLLAQLTGTRQRLFFVCTPLGSERRVASLTGVATPLSGPAPSAIVVHPLSPNTANRDVPLFTKNWRQADPANPDPDDFLWAFPNNLPTPLTLHTMRLLQYGLILDGQGQFGITEPRHDAPRRFVISGRDILPGARLIVNTPDDPAAPLPDPELGLEQMITHRISLPLYATDRVDAAGNPVWETAVELEPMVYLTLLNGGPFAPGVEAASTDFQATIPEPPPAGTFDPLGYGFHHVQIANPDGQVTQVGWVRLSL